MNNNNNISGNRTGSHDLLKVLLTLKENIMRDLNVGDIAKVTQNNDGLYTVVPLNNSNQRLYCYKLKSISVDVGDLVFITFTNTDNRANLKKVMSNKATQNLESNQYHSSNFGIITGSFSKEGGGGGSSINVIDNLTSTSTTDALSANQGRVLNEKIISAEGEIENKQDVITDLNEIRNGASAGSTALQVTDIIDNVISTYIDKALSANMGKLLQDQINNLKSRGRYLSLWNCITGLPADNPTYLPYNYNTGDYFIIGTVAPEGQTNYIPNGSSYNGYASTTTTTDIVQVDDVYYYDGTSWHLQVNTRRIIGFANIAGQPTDNSNLASALNAKENTSNKTTTINSSSTNTQYPSAKAVYNYAMTKTDPTGTGTLNMNRRSDSDVGSYSSTLGYNNIASGKYSLASGNNANASGDNTAAIGLRTYTSLYAPDGAMAIGKYNDFRTFDTTALFMVGNGTSINDRKNAFVVEENGNTHVYGNEEVVGNLKAAGLTDGTTTKTMSQILAGGGGVQHLIGTTSTPINLYSLSTGFYIIEGYMKRTSTTNYNLNPVLLYKQSSTLAIINSYILNTTTLQGTFGDGYTTFTISSSGATFGSCYRAISANGSAKSNSIYAPTTGGTSGQFLKSNGSTSTPTWQTVTLPNYGNWDISNDSSGNLVFQYL